MAAKPAPEDVRALRARHGLTQKDVARICQTTERTVQRWESDPATVSAREIPPTAWLLIRAAVGEYRPRIPTALVRKRPGPKPAKPSKAPAKPHKADPPAKVASPPEPTAAAVAAAPAVLASTSGRKRLGDSELDRLRRLAQSSK